MHLAQCVYAHFHNIARDELFTKYYNLFHVTASKV